MAGIDFRLDRRAVSSILNDESVERVLRAEAERIAARARERRVVVGGFASGSGASSFSRTSRAQDRPIPVRVDSQRNSPVARAAVILAHPAGLAVEAKHRLLGGSL